LIFENRLEGSFYPKVIRLAIVAGDL